jgi:hypothetical protein
MPRRYIGSGLALVALSSLSDPAGALDEIVGARGWEQVDYAERGACRAEVRGNGQFYRIAGQGVRPGEAVRIQLRNTDLKPIEYRVVANGDGAWRNFYVPFAWHLDGGVVDVDLASETCSLSLAFDWARRRP